MELYRGKSKETGDWIIGAVVCIGDRAFVLTTPYLEPERPSYNGMAMGCGLEDRELEKNGYQAAEYGWEEALERYEENFPEWVELVPETVTRCCQKHDIPGNVLFEGDVYRNERGKLFEICYGKHYVYVKELGGYMENVGFFVISQNKMLPSGKFAEKDVGVLGKTESYAYLVGNVFDNPELSQISQDAEPGAAQALLMPAT